MSRSNASTFRLVRMPLRRQQDVVLCRQRARTIARELAFDALDQVRIATAVSEIARNAIEYAHGAIAEFQVDLSRPTFLTTIGDQGAGIPNLDEILAGRYVSQTGLGCGIVGAHRLMDRVEIQSTAKGTTVRMEKNLARGRPLTPAEVQRIAGLLERPADPDPLLELEQQNRELAQALAELQTQKSVVEQRASELEQMSVELAETNRGVLALYDELDSLHRLGRVIAGQLDLDSLIRAIMEATTDLGAAEFGGFFHRAASGVDSFYSHVTLGEYNPLAGRRIEATVADLFGEPTVPESVVRIDDLKSENAPRLLVSQHGLRSYLAVPVLDNARGLRAAMIFGHRQANRFSERNERILGAVAAQAAVGMENARLFSSVQAANAAKDQFLATLSHELRTPLNPIFILLSELRADSRLPAGLQDDLAVIQRNLDLEARLIDDLLDMTRIVKGKVTLRPELAEVHGLLRETAMTCSANSQLKNVEVAFELDAGQSHVHGDKTRLQQVFWNVLNNAIKFTPEFGTVHIRTWNPADTDSICIEFVDSGRGISSSSLGQIFEAFEQGDAGNSGRFGGLGLGLTIAQAILEAHGGTIEARSEGLGHGATFVITLKTASVKHEGEVASASARPRVADSASWSILLVDDHADTLSTLHRIMTRRGHTVFIARDVASAVAIANTESLDFLISDIGLPDRSGLDLIKEVHAIQAVIGIALSGFGAAADIGQSQAAGFYGHLIKPIDVEELFATMAKAVNEKST